MRMLTPPDVSEESPVLTAMPPLTPDVVLPVLTVMLPLSPLEPGSWPVAIVMEPESSAVPTPLVTLTAPPC